MASRDAVPFQAPPNLAVEVDLPNGGRVKGLGIRKGVTLIGEAHCSLSGIELGSSRITHGSSHFLQTRCVALPKPEI